MGLAIRKAIEVWDQCVADVRMQRRRRRGDHMQSKSRTKAKAAVIELVKIFWDPVANFMYRRKVSRKVLWRRDPYFVRVRQFLSVVHGGERERAREHHFIDISGAQ